ncbi:MAG: hypothetical protein KatS3mg087_1029 [Patescibacteria group bacterium]|nr:MAG: hypothetical protein KatS3mg087_1029 [Patescibacteria group bacterium]
MASASFLINVDAASVNGETHSIGSKSSTVQLTITGIVLDQAKTLASGAIWNAWDELSSTISDFVVLVILSTQEIEIELTTDRDGTNERAFVVRAAANVPFILSSGKSINGYIKNWGGGTPDNIDRIRIKNISTSDASVRILLAK